jgi:long-chain acyl-CoA synthetase
MPNTITTDETLVTLLPLAVERHGERVAVRYRDAAGWRDLSYAEVAEIATSIALGLADVGVARSERVAILASTRPEWTYVDFAISMAGGVVVPIYPTNSPQECEWVLADSDAVAVVCENASQVAKVMSVRARLRRLRTIISIEPAHGALSLDELRNAAVPGIDASSTIAPEPFGIRIRTRSSTHRARQGRRRGASLRTATSGRCST